MKTLEQAYQQIFEVPELTGDDKLSVNFLEEIARGTVLTGDANITLEQALEVAENDDPEGIPAKKYRTQCRFREWYLEPTRDNMEAAFLTMNNSGLEPLYGQFFNCQAVLKMNRIAELTSEFDRAVRWADRLTEQDGAKIILITARELAESGHKELREYIVGRIPAYASHFQLGPDNKLLDKHTHYD